MHPSAKSLYYPLVWHWDSQKGRDFCKSAKQAIQLARHCQQVGGWEKCKIGDNKKRGDKENTGQYILLSGWKMQNQRGEEKVKEVGIALYWKTQICEEREHKRNWAAGCLCLCVGKFDQRRKKDRRWGKWSCWIFSTSETKGITRWSN